MKKKLQINDSHKLIYKLYAEEKIIEFIETIICTLNMLDITFTISYYPYHHYEFEYVPSMYVQTVYDNDGNYSSIEIIDEFEDHIIDVVLFNNEVVSISILKYLRNSQDDIEGMKRIIRIDSSEDTNIILNKYLELLAAKVN